MEITFTISKLQADFLVQFCKIELSEVKTWETPLWLTEQVSQEGPGDQK